MHVSIIVSLSVLGHGVHGPKPTNFLHPCWLWQHHECLDTVRLRLVQVSHNIAGGLARVDKL